MKFEKGTEIIWQDRKRRLGLPLSFYRYYLVKKEGEWVKLFRHKGFFTSILDEINCYRLLDVSLIQTVGDKIFKTGTIRILSNDASAPLFHLRHIKHPFEVRNLVSNTMEAERRKRNVAITELQGK